MYKRQVIIAGILIFALYGIFSNSKNSSDDLYIAPSTNQEMQFDYTVPSNPVPNDSGSNPVIIPDSYSDYTVSEPVPEWCGIDVYKRQVLDRFVQMISAFPLFTEEISELNSSGSMEHSTPS